MKYTLTIRGAEIAEIEADNYEHAEDKARDILFDDFKITPAVELSFPKMIECLHYAMTQVQTSGGEILEGITVDEIAEMKKFVRAAEQLTSTSSPFTEIGKTVITAPNASHFLHWVENEAYQLIQESIDDDDVKPIVIELYGQRVEIDTHADNYEALTTFLKKVIEYGKDD